MPVCPVCLNECIEIKDKKKRKKNSPLWGVSLFYLGLKQVDICHALLKQ